MLQIAQSYQYEMKGILNFSDEENNFKLAKYSGELKISVFLITFVWKR